MDKTVGRLQAKRAIVTGAVSGLDTGITQKFLLVGASVVMADINQAAANRAADEWLAKSCHASNQRGLPCAVDVASTAGGDPSPRLSRYNEQAGWMIAATEAMAVELAPLVICVPLRP